MCISRTDKSKFYKIIIIRYLGILTNNFSELLNFIEKYKLVKLKVIGKLTLQTSLIIIAQSR